MKILYLEDDPVDFELVKSTVENEIDDVSFVHAVSKNNFETALDQNEIDLILCDYNIPGFDGLSALNVKNNYKMDIPFIFVSGTIGEDIAVESLKNGATDYILKTNLNRLLPSIQRAIRERNEHLKLKKAESKIYESEKKFRVLVENSTDLTYFMDEKSIIKYVSPSVKNILGYEENELLEKVGMELIHPDDRPAAIEALKSITIKETNSNHKEELVYRIKHKSGKYRWFAGRAQNLLNIPEVNSIVVNARDISEKVEAENRKKESEKKYRILYETMVQGVVYQSKDGSIIDCNAAAERMLGLTLLQMQGRKSVDPRWKSVHEDMSLFPGEEHPSMLALKTGKQVKDVIMGIFNPKKEKYVWLNINAIPQFRKGDKKPFQVYTTFEDITEQKEVLDELQNSEKRLRILLENAPDAIFIQDLEGNILDANNAAEKLSGFKREETFGKSIFELNLLNQEDSARVFNNIKKSVAGNPVGPERFSITNKNNEQKEVEIISYPVIVFGERQILSIARDISERLKFEENLKKAKEDAEEMSRLKSVFLANMSHELRTPLIGIIGYADFLISELKDPDLIEMAKMILKSGDRLTTTLNSILDLSKLESNKMDLTVSELSISRFIKDVVNRFEKKAKEKEIELIFNFKVNDVIALLDENIIAQILNNLIDNAIKYTAKGEVTIELSSELKENEKYAIIKVIDTGIGIENKNLQKIFEPFRQASEGYSRTFEGTGLGLTLTKKYVELLNGEISVESKPGNGSTFIVKLPAIEIINMNDKIINNKKLPEVLLVEDDVMTISIIKIFLRDIVRVDDVETGEDALRKVRKNKYDIILMDIGLKGMTGLETTKQLREMPDYKKTPIIAITAFAMAGDKEEILRGGCSHYISKPFDKEQLVDLINNLVNKTK